MNTKIFAQLIQDGIKPVVTFNKRVEGKYCYAESHMRARVIGAEFCHDDVIKFKVDYSEFEEFNKAYESAKYYDDKVYPTLTARQAGRYKVTEIIYEGADSEVCFDVEESNRLKVYELYKQDSNDLSYVQWLEDKVTRMMETVGLDASFKSN